MNAFGSPRAGCAFRMLGLALLMFGGLCGFIAVDMPVSEYTPIFLVVAAGLMVWGAVHLLDTRRTERADGEHRDTFKPTSGATASQLMKQAKDIVDHMPNYNGDLDALRPSGWVDFPGSVIVTYERTLKQKHGTVPVCISIGFTASGEQYGPYYHLEPFYPQPGDY